MPDHDSCQNTWYDHTRQYKNMELNSKTEIAGNIVSAMIMNYISLFKKNLSMDTEPLISELQTCIQKISETTSLSKILFYKKTAKEIIFKIINRSISVSWFHSYSRKKRNPDPLNCLINCGCYLLFTHCQTTIRSKGLHPGLGFLHSNNTNTALVCDLMEPFYFRVTGLILRMIQQEKITKKLFIKSNSEWQLTPDGMGNFARAFEEELLSIKAGDRGSLKNLIGTQVLCVYDWVKTRNSLRIYTRERVR